MTDRQRMNPDGSTPQVAKLLDQLRAASGQRIIQNDEQVQAARAAALEGLLAFNDQVQLFHDVREIVFADMALTSFPATCVRRIRGLYEAFDTKHPNQSQKAVSPSEGETHQ
jgi:hypothetical protein